ncbi:uncharacterized BrkB/YihY/UPF0761 family membrane protein [Dysgonomonas sp. PFB1-18]|uniref:hypothetical protein n=1 Tax=unclassified Dysgonomonas TaxID=2630389 RepID=UPI0024753C1D|nr:MULTISPECIES: hypothetical protein [unclassified Dysgonomonas]MDH6309564.1 uncharacterized BrkB/YihY/UPF0761 family membrane protein [Dysgonomonas sp. PF1-14]MDH6339108.1 uncharacterized BrkB/YihY/UPF0761 family membrane protein [Dysgonomonas sp. PF1-16]MDH6380606.1 uncharacterized BrkB/YihY/UPF0761 family membrane protein [Dysgonomonas sp. PFB1-18]MDH6398102.1 uncharacterized BrkB/YihY/UPF0761 family membrane protein [Dysgonomonas sp. PF1-23]
MKPTKYILYFLGGLLSLFTIFFGIMFYSRSQMEYNDFGNHYDSESGIVYHEHTMELYGFLFFVSFIFMLLFFISSKLVKAK